MKRSRLPARFVCVVLVLAMIQAAACVGFAAEVKDVPKDHWAYQAVKLLVEKGYLAVYGDGTFQGTKAVDRYTLAVVIAKILKEIETGRVGATPEDVELLRKLSGDFRQELVAVAADMDVFKKSLDEQGKGQAVMREDLARLTFTQRQMRAEVEKMIADIATAAQKGIADASAKAEEADKKLAARIDENEKALAEAGAKAEEADNKLAARIDENENRIALLSGDVTAGFANTASSLKDLADRMGAGDSKLALRLDAHDAALAQLNEDFDRGLDAATLRLDAIEPQVASLGKDLAAAREDFAKGLDTLQVNLGAARGDILTLRRDLDGLSARVDARDAQLEKDVAALATRTSDLDQELAALAARTLSLEQGLAAQAAKAEGLDQGLTAERAARISTDASIQSALTDLASDLAGHKAQTAKDIESLRKENGLLKVLLGVVAVLGLVIK